MYIYIYIYIAVAGHPLQRRGGLRLCVALGRGQLLIRFQDVFIL